MGKKRYAVMANKYNELLHRKEFNDMFFEANISEVKELKRLEEQLQMALKLELCMAIECKGLDRFYNETEKCRYEVAIRHELKCIRTEQPLTFSWQAIHIPFLLRFHF